MSKPKQPKRQIVFHGTVQVNALFGVVISNFHFEGYRHERQQKDAAIQWAIAALEAARASAQTLDRVSLSGGQVKRHADQG